MATTTACGVLRTPSSAAFWKRLRGGFLRVCSACARKGLAEFAPPRNARCLLVLAGLPGSGKTNLALEIEGQRGQYAWERVCQDELGRRSKCKEAVRRALRDGRRGVVVDRTNLDAKQRCHWVELAREAAAEGEGSPVVTIALAIDVGLDTCLSRVNERQDHPSLPPSKAGLVASMAKGFELPTHEEGFFDCNTASDNSEAKTLLAEMLANVRQSYG